ncbi:uncharacterized protein LOC129590675 [Paramacrobiotus metropolitanus]|uniref:uncharacterized protein LOC129590675 n=1 Tax=Paramacrobiotus metropolitanus TaxID=2943436 RepID=UPI002445DD5E|nr:uncharacterized protein LOC129590675 [Paramacrobiotus metropolitanus]XP_055341996.1 uncharacterized protein LOC129590675 [Paramacrobiotus metropolitanus]
MVSTPLPPYERLLIDAQQMSYQNTVIVRHDADVYWLGNIQNISGDYAFIDFQSSKAKPSWIHASRVWPLHFPHDEYRHGKTQVFVALRDEDDGPFRFRPALRLKIATACGHCQTLIFYVETLSRETESTSCLPRTDMVDKCQIALRFPVTEPSLLCRVDGLMFRRLFIPFFGARYFCNYTSDRFHIIKHFRDTLKRNAQLATLSDCCRFHLRIQQDGCTFVVISLAADPETAQWMATALRGMLLTHIVNRANLPPHDDRNFIGTGELPYKTDGKADQLNKCVSFNNLPPFLLSEILSFLELHSCVRVKRVCVLWQQLLSSDRATEHIRVCFGTCADATKSGNLNCYKTAYLLSRTVRSNTKSITILNPFLNYNYLSDLLEAMEIKLPVIIFKDYTITDCGNLYSYSKVSRSDGRKLLEWHGATIWLRFYQDSCQRIVLHNWKLSNIFGKALDQIFFDFCGSELHALPAHEVQWMQTLTHESRIDVLGIDKIQITIRKLVLDCSVDWESMISKFMWALDSNFAPVADEVYVKVKNVHARWVRTLAFPQEWDTIRVYLSVFSGFHADGTPKFWNEIDLRLVDVYKLSRMAVLGLAELFRV